MIWRRSLLLIICWLIQSSSFAHQGSDPQQLKPLRYDVSVIMKLIQVYVTDKDGRPVRGLTKEDFAVFDDGRAVALTEFEKHNFYETEPESNEKGGGRPETGPPPASQAISSSKPIFGRKLFIFFDFAYNTQNGAVAALKVARRFLDGEIRLDDEVAVISYSALKGLRFHEFLTRDHVKVRRAVAEMSAEETAGRAEEIEMMYWKAAEEDPSNLKSSVKSNLNWRRQETKSLATNYFASLTSLAKTMRIIEGQKHFLFFSTGLPYSLIYGGQAGSPTGQARFGGRGGGPEGSTFDMGDPILRPLAEGMLKEFSASGCSVFGFDTREAAKIASLFAYEENIAETGGLSAFVPDGVFQTKTDLLRDDKTTGQDVLRRFSKETGGEYFSNIARFEENLETVRNLTGTYYVLGYAISAPKDGEYHKIKVEVKRKDCRIKAQGGYFNPKPFSEYSDLEKQIHLFDLALNERAEGRARREFGVAALSYDAGSGPRLRLISRIPKATAASFEGGKVEFVALTFDEQGNPVSLERKTADLEACRGREVLFTSGTNPPPGKYACRVIIRDLKTGDSAVASAEANVIKPGAAELSLATPLLYVPGEAPVSLEAGRKGPLESPAWQEIYAVGAEGLVPATGELPPSGRAVVVVPCAAGPGPAKVEYSARLVDMSDGKALPFEWTETGRSRAGNLETARFELSWAGLPPGKCQLYFHAVDTTGLQAQSHAPVIIGPAMD